MSGFKNSETPQIGVATRLRLPNYIKKPILKIAAAGTHCMLIDSDKKVWVWGYGLLGKGLSFIIALYIIFFIKKLILSKKRSQM